MSATKQKKAPECCGQGTIQGLKGNRKKNSGLVPSIPDNTGLGIKQSIGGNLILIFEKPDFQLRDWMRAIKKQRKKGGRPLNYKSIATTFIHIVTTCHVKPALMHLESFIISSSGA